MKIGGFFLRYHTIPDPWSIENQIFTTEALCSHALEQIATDHKDYLISFPWQPPLQPFA